MPIVRIEYTQEFIKNLRWLSKKYRHIQDDLQSVIAKLQTGTMVGDKIPGTGYPVFKARIRNTDLKKGKSGGYRLIYWLKINNTIVFITLYAKSYQGTISSHRLREIIKEYEN